MVTGKRKLVSIEEAKRIITESKNSEEAVKKLDNLPKRQPKPLPPEGGISLRAAERKYGIPNQTISRWVQKGYVLVKLRTNNELYVDESNLQEVIETYKSSSGQGKSTLRQKIGLS